MTNRRQDTKRRRFHAVLLILMLAVASPASHAAADPVQRAQELLARSEYDAALAVATAALAEARRSGDEQREAWLLSAVGNAHFGLSHMQEALDTFQATLSAMREIGDRYGEAAALKDVGITCKYLGRYDDALSSLYAALAVYEATHEPCDMAVVLDMIGGVYASLGADELARDSYGRALELAETTDYGTLSAITSTRLGLLTLRLGDEQRALELLEGARRTAEEREIAPEYLAFVLQGHAAGLAETGRVDEAVLTCRHALDLSRRRGTEIGVAGSLRMLGNLSIARDLDEAARNFEAAIEIYERHDIVQAWDAYAGLARVHRRKGDLARAVALYRKGIALLESVRGRIESSQNRATFLGGNQTIYRELADTLLEWHERDPASGLAALAFEAVEQAKARATLDAVAGAREEIVRELEPDLRAREEELGARVAELQKRLGSSTGDPARGELRRAMRDAEAEIDRLVVEIRRRSPRYAAVRYPEPLPLERIQTSLDERTAIVEYFASDDRFFAFVVTSRSFGAVRLDTSPSVVAARVRTYLDLLARGEDDGWREIGRRLHAELIAPVLPHLPPGAVRVAVVPDGALHDLPFETLVAGDERLLVEEIDLSYAPSAAVLAELLARPEASPRAMGLAVFAGPVPPAALTVASAPDEAGRMMRLLYDEETLRVPSIPSSAVEAREIARYAAAASEVYTGAEASERRVKTVGLGRFRVLHFATHGLVSEEAPSRSALVLSSEERDGEDGLLQVREIYHLELDSDLVVLSACRTARGRLLAGEGVQGLARAFFVAGARSVVATLWDVDDERTALFMRTFYRNLGSGMSKSGALRATKLELERNPETSSPRYWAPFILLGEPAQSVPIAEPAQIPWALLLSVGAALAALLTLLFWKSRPGYTNCS